jgi:hypothetical protein
MPETASRDAQPGTSRRLYRNKAGRLMIIATSLTLMLPTYDYTRRRSARLHKIAGLHLRDCVSDYARADRMKAQGISTGNCDRVTRIADYHLSLVEKYSQAARYPWLPVAPDPPEPE